MVPRTFKQAGRLRRGLTVSAICLVMGIMVTPERARAGPARPSAATRAGVTLTMFRPPT